jgi:hypothetical protein
LPPGSGSSSSSSSEDAGWRAFWGQPPVPLAIADAKAVYGQQHSINEKNWMPFVWQVGAAAVLVCAAGYLCRFVPLAVADVKGVYGQQHSINEKNWMPFVWQVGAAVLICVVDIVVGYMALCM